MTGSTRVSQWSAVSVWDEACKRLKALLHPDVYSKWIGVIKADGLADSTLTLSVDNDFYQTWLEENYLPFIKQSVQSVYGSEIGIRFTVKPEALRLGLDREPDS